MVHAKNINFQIAVRHAVLVNPVSHYTLLDDDFHMTYNELLEKSGMTNEQNINELIRIRNTITDQNRINNPTIDDLIIKDYMTSKFIKITIDKLNKLLPRDKTYRFLYFHGNALAEHEGKIEDMDNSDIEIDQINHAIKGFKIIVSGVKIDVHDIISIYQLKSKGIQRGASKRKTTRRKNQKRKTHRK